MLRHLPAGAFLALAVLSPASAEVQGALNPQRAWFVEAVPNTGFCGAANFGKPASFAFIGIEGGQTFTVTGEGIPKGQTAALVADGHVFTFTPEYPREGQLAFFDLIPEADLAAIRNAEFVELTIDDKPVMRVVGKASGLSEVLDALAACSLGESGWWGKGAPQKP